LSSSLGEGEAKTGHRFAAIGFTFWRIGPDADRSERH
jgi:hypothetical protein